MLNLKKSKTDHHITINKSYHKLKVRIYIIKNKNSESLIEDKSLSVNEIGIEIDNQINNSNSCNRPNRRKRIFWCVEIIFNNYNEIVISIEKMDSPINSQHQKWN
ncbi:hypothetical protein BpHYR1_053354 [Brachionus plicatilis]|uniref:Uncharacterized protein n=1 Tax=Brachionus plicatilis TaxID=10195 RepID=A0A3M7QWG3_BRAPC|nr:hypothetical protein BpHYR1_053354 [Brachionus plicatilis]